MASFALRATPRSGETLPFPENITAFHAGVRADQQFFPPDHERPADMFEMIVDLPFPDGQQLGNFQGIDLLTAQQVNNLLTDGGQDTTS